MQFCHGLHIVFVTGFTGKYTNIFRGNSLAEGDNFLREEFFQGEESFCGWVGVDFPGGGKFPGRIFQIKFYSEMGDLPA
jgi:hypothetical protein